MDDGTTRFNLNPDDLPKVRIIGHPPFEESWLLGGRVPSFWPVALPLPELPLAILPQGAGARVLITSLPRLLWQPAPGLQPVGRNGLPEWADSPRCSP